MLDDVLDEEDALEDVLDDPSVEALELDSAALEDDVASSSGMSCASFALASDPSSVVASVGLGIEASAGAPASSTC